MGQIFADILLSNLANSALNNIQTKALLDAGVLFLYIPEHNTI